MQVQLVTGQAVGAALAHPINLKGKNALGSQDSSHFAADKHQKTPK